MVSTTFPVSTVNMLENTARSWYDAGYVNLRRRYSDGLSLLANYTLAKNLSDAPDFRSPMFESAIPQNNNDLRAEKGPSCDIRHRFALSAVYDIPAWQRTVGAASDTQLAAIDHLSGRRADFPFTISVFGDTANAGAVLGENPIRANYTGQPVFGPEPATRCAGLTPRHSPPRPRLHSGTSDGTPLRPGMQSWTSRSCAPSW